MGGCKNADFLDWIESCFSVQTKRLVIAAHLGDGGDGLLAALEVTGDRGAQRVLGGAHVLARHGAVGVGEDLAGGRRGRELALAKVLAGGRALELGVDERLRRVVRVGRYVADAQSLK